MTITDLERAAIERWDELVQYRTIVTESGCWEWQGARAGGTGGPGRYGTFGFRHKRFYAHRLALIWATGASIPEGMAACHKCDNPPCCNPDHLELGTPKFNTQCASKRGLLRNQDGERNAQAKLTDAEVEGIRQQLMVGATGAELARRYGVSTATISLIRNNRRRKNNGAPGGRPQSIHTQNTERNLATAG